MTPIRLVIFGSRDCRPTFGAIEQTLLRLDLGRRPDLVLSGAEPNGADSCGEQWARAAGIPIEFIAADWGRFGNYAGPIRNRQLAERATHGIGFWKNDSRGTANMAAQLLVLDRPVRLVRM